MTSGMRIERHTPTGWWLEEAGEPRAQPRLAGALEADVVIVGGGYGNVDRLARPRARAHRAGGGAGGRRLRAWPERAQRWLLRVALAQRADAPRSLRRWPGAALLDASSESVGAIGAWCRDTGIDAWYRRSGYICVSPRPSTAWEGRPRPPPRRSALPSEWSSSTSATCGRAAPRRCSGAASSSRTSPPSSPRGSPSGCSSGSSSAELLVFEHAGAGASKRRRPGARRDHRRLGARTGSRPRRRAGGPGLAASVAPGRDLLAHRAHRAGAGPARRARLDRRRMHHRRPHPRTTSPPATAGSRSAGAGGAGVRRQARRPVGGGP